MTFLPIVGRELRVASRRRGTFWLRSGVALGVIIAATWILLAARDEPPRQIGKIIFYVLTGASMLYCLSAGVRSTADCLSEEKRDGTLGLLFLTDLRGYDVVAGKLAANSLNALYGLLAVVPVLGLPLLMGGVSPGEFGRVALTLVNTLFFSLCAGMYASAISKSARTAGFVAAVIVLLFTAGVPALGAWVAWAGRLRNVQYEFFMSSPVFCYFMALDKPMLTNLKPYYWSLGIIHALGWICLALAAVVAPRSWQDRPAGAAGVRWRERWQNWWHGNADERLGFRRHMLDRSAFSWLASRPRLRPAWVWGFFALVALVWVWGILKFHNDWFNEGICVATALLLNSTLKAWVASEAGRQFLEDRKLGSMELLLTTPLTVPEILRGQRLALQRSFLLPVVVALVAELLMLFVGIRQFVGGRDWNAWFWLWFAGLTVFIADLVTLYWVGMWMGLSAKNPKRAYADTVVRVLVLPWLLFGICCTVIGLASWQARAELGWGFFLAMWVVISLAVDFIFGMWARNRLLEQFRFVATQRFQQRPSLWRRLFGRESVEGLEAPTHAE